MHLTVETLIEADPVDSTYLLHEAFLGLQRVVMLVSSLDVDRHVIQEMFGSSRNDRLVVSGLETLSGTAMEKPLWS